MSEAYELEIVLVGLPTCERNTRKRHWAAQSKEIQAWRRAIGFAVLGREPPEPLPFASVKFVRHSARRPDPTNLTESFKAVEDALVANGILEDDRTENYQGGAAVVDWEKAPPGEGFITVTVKEVTTDDDEEDPEEEKRDGGGAEEEGPS